MTDAPSWPESAAIDFQGIWRLAARQLPCPSSISGTVDDRASWGRWVQAGAWYAVLIIPGCAFADRQCRPLGELSPASLAGLSSQQAHVGVFSLQAQPEGELGTWSHELDYQPPVASADQAWLWFETPTRVVAMSAHDDSSQTWQRESADAGVAMCLAPADSRGPDAGRRLLICGDQLVILRPRRQAWPRGLLEGQTLKDVLLHEPEAALQWLDHELSMGACRDGWWTIEASTLPQREGQRLAVRWEVLDEQRVRCTLGEECEIWRILAAAPMGMRSSA